VRVLPSGESTLTITAESVWPAGMLQNVAVFAIPRPCDVFDKFLAVFFSLWADVMCNWSQSDVQYADTDRSDNNTDISTTMQVILRDTQYCSVPGLF